MALEGRVFVFLLLVCSDSSAEKSRLWQVGEEVFLAVRRVCVLLQERTAYCRQEPLLAAQGISMSGGESASDRWALQVREVQRYSLFELSKQLNRSQRLSAQGVTILGLDTVLGC
jgi:hypothetical protein